MVVDNLLMSSLVEVEVEGGEESTSVDGLALI